MHKYDPRRLVIILSYKDIKKELPKLMKEKKKVFYGWWVVIGCILLTTTLIPPVIALSNTYRVAVTEELGIAHSAFAMTNTIVGVIGILLSPFIVKLLSKGNMRLYQIIATVGYGLSYASYSLAQSAFHLYISAFFVGIFFLVAVMIPVSMIVTNWFIKSRGLAMSLAMTGIGIGGFIFSQVLTSFIANYGWRTSYRLMAIISVAVALPTLIFIIREKPADKGLKPYGADEVNTAAASKLKVSKPISISVKESKTKPFYFVLLLGMLLNGFINTGALSNFPPALQMAYDPAFAATIVSTYSFVGIFGKLLVGWIDDKYGVVASSITGCAFFAIAFVFMMIGGNPAMMYVMAFCFGIGTPIGSVNPPLVVSAIYGGENFPKVFGLVNSLIQAGMAIGGLVIATIYDASQSYNTAWILLLVLTIATMVCWIASYKMSRKYAK